MMEPREAQKSSTPLVRARRTITVGKRNSHNDVGIRDLDSRFWGAVLGLGYRCHGWHHRLRQGVSRPRGNYAELWQLVRQESRLSRWPITVAVELVQELGGADLVDLTWTESFGETLMVLSRRIALLKTLAEEPPPVVIPQVLNTIEQKLSEGHESHQAWLEERETTLTDRIPEVCLERARRVWRSKQEMLKATTQYSRRQARKLKKALGDDSYVIELRRPLGIPDNGFQDENEAARWLYDRDPPSPQLGPPIRWGWYRDRFAYQRLSPREHVPAQAQAARRLGCRLSLRGYYDAHLCMYLLRGKLEPLARLRERERPQEERDKYLLRLIDRYGYKIAAEAYNCGVTKEDVAELSTALGEPSEDVLVDALRNLATDKQIRPAKHLLTPADLHGIAHRARQYYHPPYT